MRHPVSRELFAYWDRLRAGRSAPERSAVDPAAIRDVLAYTFLLEVGEPDGTGVRAVSFRLSGTRLNALFRRDLKGGAFARLFPDGEAVEAAALIDGVLDDRTPVVAGLRGGPEGYASADFELLLLPLRHHGRTHARILGSIAAETVPSWAGLRPIAGLRVASFRTVLAPEGSRIGAFGAAARLAAGISASDRTVAAAPMTVAAGGRPALFKVYQGGRAAVDPSARGPAVDLG